MGNRVPCCRHMWSEFDDEDQNLVIDDYGSPHAGYLNQCASFHPELLQTKSDPHIFSVKSNGIQPARLPYRSVSGFISTQHISEREPEDTEDDPSWNSSRRSLFVVNGIVGQQSSSVHIRHRIKNLQSTVNRIDNSQLGLRRWSSCGTIYIGDGCLVCPHKETTLWGVAIAVELLTKRSNGNPSNITPSSPTSNNTRSLYNSNLFSSTYKLFDERRFPIGRYPDSVNLKRNLLIEPPQAYDVHTFLLGLFSSAFLGPQCAILSLVLLERLINSVEVSLFPWSWRRQLLACVLIASKVLDDQAVWNTDYCQILRDVSIDDINALERHTLSLLQFNIDVPPAVYARYYFDLLQAVEARDIANRPSARRRLTPELARDLRIIPTPSEQISPKGTQFMLFDFPSNFSDRNNVDSTLKTIRSCKQTSQRSLTNSDAKTNSSQFIVSEKSLDTTRPIGNRLTENTSSHCSSEGPLILDDETEFINSLTSPLSSTSYVRSSFNSTSNNPHTPPYRTFLPTSVHRNPNKFTHTHCPSNWASTSTTNDASDKPPNNSNRTGFIKSIMGGEVAYSLLRDAGVY